MARNSSISSLISNVNTNKKTFKSYIDLDIKSSSDPQNTDEMWTTFDENGKSTDLSRMRRNSSILYEPKDHRIISRSASSIGTLLNDTIDGVNYFYSHTRHRTGICGQLSLNNNGLMFVSYTSQPIDENCEQKTNTLSHFIPFNSHKSANFEIDLLAIDLMKESFDNNFISITILCSNFRRIRFQIKNSEQTKRIVDKLRRLSNTIDNKYSKLTKSLKDNYSYLLKADWNQFESHWKECYKLRITQTNENYQLCDSLPPSFIVPKQITDQMLISMISTQTRGQRVPVVSYLYPQNGYLLIRSSAFDNIEDLNTLLRDLVTPLRQINVESVFPSLLVVEQSYEKLKEVCFQYNSTEESNNCINKIGKWINCVNTYLKGVQKMVEIITNEASVGLVEESDRDLNCIVSSLVQLMIDPKRRTIVGFESLLSKEWLHLSGLTNRKISCLNPNHILFTLFIDCVFQLIIQNPFEFEFSSFYLIYLFDCQYTQSSTPFFPNIRKNSKISLDLELRCPPLRQELSLNHQMLIQNPFYGKRQSNDTLRLNGHISQMHFWSALYLRWQSKPNLEHLSPSEFIYLNHLQSINIL